MHLRRPLALTAGALVLSLGGLTSCGFNAATDRPYTPGEGTVDDDGPVKVLSALIVAAQPNQGTLVITLANTSPDDDATLNGVAGPDLEVSEFEPIEVVARDSVNFALETEGNPILVTGDFDAGQLLPLTLTYANGDTSTLDVPIVTACDEHEGLDLTVDSEFIPYDCEYEAPPVGEEGDSGEVDPAGGGAEDSE